MRLFLSDKFLLIQLDLRASPSTPPSLPSIKVQANVEEVCCKKTSKSSSSSFSFSSQRFSCTPPFGCNTVSPITLMLTQVHLLLPSLPLSHLSLTIDGSPRVEVTVAKQEVLFPILI